MSVIATVGGGPAFLVQEIFGPEWSLRFAAVVFVVGGIVATKIRASASSSRAKKHNSSGRNCTSRASCSRAAPWR